MFFTVFVLCILRLFKLKTDGQAEIQKSSMQNYKTQIKILLILGEVNRAFNNKAQELHYLAWLNLCSITQLVDYCKSCILIGYATTGLLVIVIE